MVADRDARGQVDVMVVARTVLPGVNDQWIYSAVQTFESRGWVYNVVRAISPAGIGLMVTGEGRRKAESFG